MEDFKFQQPLQPQTVADSSEEKPSSLGLLSGLIGLLALCSILYQFALLPSYTQQPVSQLQVHGNQWLSRSEIAEHLKVATGETWLDIDPFILSLQLKQLPWVKTAIVRKNFQNGLDVFLTEETPSAYFKAKNQLFYISPKGKLLPLKTSTGELSLPVLVDESQEGLTAGSQLQLARISKGLRLMESLRSSTTLPLDNISEIIITNPMDFQLITRKQGITIHFGENNFAAKLAKLQLAFSEIAPRLSKLKSIDLRNFQGIAIQE